MMLDILDIDEELFCTGQLHFVSSQHATHQHSFQDENFAGVADEEHAKLFLERITQNNFIPCSRMTETAIASNYSIEEVMQGLESNLQTE